MAPKKLIENTQKSLAHYKANPRPPSALPSKMTAPTKEDSSEKYSDEDYEESFDEDQEEDPMAKVRKAIHKENTKAKKIQESGKLVQP